MMLKLILVALVGVVAAEIKSVAEAGKNVVTLDHEDAPATFVGCFADQRNPRLLSLKAGTGDRDFNKKQCSFACRHTRYFGLEYPNGDGRSQCWCGDNIPLGAVPQIGLCNGGKGGEWKIAVFENAGANETECCAHHRNTFIALPAIKKGGKKPVTMCPATINFLRANNKMAKDNNVKIAANVQICESNVVDGADPFWKDYSYSLCCSCHCVDTALHVSYINENGTLVSNEERVSASCFSNGWQISSPTIDNRGLKKNRNDYFTISCEKVEDKCCAPRNHAHDLCMD